jgi:hypothetical protein
MRRTNKSGHLYAEIIYAILIYAVRGCSISVVSAARRGTYQAKTHRNRAFTPSCFARAVGFGRAANSKGTIGVDDLANNLENSVREAILSEMRTQPLGMAALPPDIANRTLLIRSGASTSSRTWRMPLTATRERCTWRLQPDPTWPHERIYPIEYLSFRDQYLERLACDKRRDNFSSPRNSSVYLFTAFGYSAEKFNGESLTLTPTKKSRQVRKRYGFEQRRILPRAAPFVHSEIPAERNLA